MPARLLKAIGMIEIRYLDGRFRTYPVAAGSDLLLAAVRGYELWEAADGKARMRLERLFEDGSRICICHLPPAGEEWTE